MTIMHSLAAFALVTRVSLAEIAIVDFRPFLFGSSDSKAAVVDQIKDALATRGFFLIENHGVPETLIESTMEMQRDFFHRNISEKQPYAKLLDGTPHGISGWYENELLYGSTPDRKESYDLLLDALVDDYETWFDDEQLTDILNLAVAMKSTTQSILKALSLALGAEETFLSGLHNNLANSYLRMVYYAQDDAKDEPGLLLHPHTDFLTLTAGFQDENGGLEVWDKAAKQWVEVPFVKGAMIVNIGDAMQRWSNDRFVANFHRIPSRNVATAKERFSFYMFVGPRYEQIVDPRAFGVEDADAKYPAMRFTEFYEERLKYTFGDEKERNDHHITGDADALKDMDDHLDVRGCRVS